MASHSNVMPIMSVKDMLDRQTVLYQLKQNVLTDTIDYGTIPGTPKPTLYKPGAEKAAVFFGLTPEIVKEEKELDWTGERHGGEPFFFFQYQYRMMRDGVCLGVGIGSANSMEIKHRYRWVTEDKIPDHLKRDDLPRRSDMLSEFEFAVNKAETTGQYGKPKEYWDKFKSAIQCEQARRFMKKTKSGKEMVAYEIGGYVYRIPNSEIFDAVNPLQKMAQKRGYIAAVLMAIGLSELFTQDLEDFDIPPIYVDPAPVAETVEKKFPLAAVADAVPDDDVPPPVEPDEPPPPPVQEKKTYGPLPLKKGAEKPTEHQADSAEAVKLIANAKAAVATQTGWDEKKVKSEYVAMLRDKMPGVDLRSLDPIKALPYIQEWASTFAVEEPPPPADEAPKPAPTDAKGEILSLMAVMGFEAEPEAEAHLKTKGVSLYGDMLPEALAYAKMFARSRPVCTLAPQAAKAANMTYVTLLKTIEQIAKKPIGECRQADVDPVLASIFNRASEKKEGKSNA